MTNKRLKVVPAIARLDAKPRRQTKVERLRQQRQAAAWKRQQAQKSRRND